MASKFTNLWIIFNCNNIFFPTMTLISIIVAQNSSLPIYAWRIICWYPLKQSLSQLLQLNMFFMSFQRSWVWKLILIRPVLITMLLFRRWKMKESWNVYRWRFSNNLSFTGRLQVSHQYYWTGIFIFL